MPGPNVINRERDARKAAAVERKAYYLTDPNCREIMGLTVTDAMRENGLVLTSGEAMALLASGAITTDKASAQAAASEMKAQHEALVQKRQDAVEAQAALAEASADAAMHNAGEKTSTVVEGTKSASEVDQHMATAPDTGTAPADQAPTSAETPAATWAGEQPQQAS